MRAGGSWTARNSLLPLHLGFHLLLEDIAPWLCVRLALTGEVLNLSASPLSSNAVLLPCGYLALHKMK